MMHLYMSTILLLERKLLEAYCQWVMLHMQLLLCYTQHNK